MPRKHRPTRAHQELIAKHKNLTNDYVYLRQENNRLERKLQEKLDISMIESRTKLASQFGQLLESVATSIRVLIGKEVM